MTQIEVGPPIENAHKKQRFINVNSPIPRTLAKSREGATVCVTPGDIEANNAKYAKGTPSGNTQVVN